MIVEVERLRAALTFYADDDNYIFQQLYDGSKVQWDKGEIASAALERK